jgi:hypothetical protein
MKYLLLFLSLSAFGQNKIIGELSPEDQKYYRNQSGMGMNQLERIDSLVKEVNKVYKEVGRMKSQIQELRAEVDELKKKK